MSVVTVIFLVLGLFALLGLVAWGVVVQSQFQAQYVARFETPRAAATPAPVAYTAAPSLDSSRELVGQSA